jgi:hypothetical protein
VRQAIRVQFLLPAQLVRSAADATLRASGKLWPIAEPRKVFSAGRESPNRTSGSMTVS